MFVICNNVSSNMAPLQGLLNLLPFSMGFNPSLTGAAHSGLSQNIFSLSDGLQPTNAVQTDAAVSGLSPFALAYPLKVARGIRRAIISP